MYLGRLYGTRYDSCTGWGKRRTWSKSASSSWSRPWPWGAEVCTTCTSPPTSSSSSPSAINCCLTRAGSACKHRKPMCSSSRAQCVELRAVVQWYQTPHISIFDSTKDRESQDRTNSSIVQESTSKVNQGSCDECASQQCALWSLLCS